MSSTAAKLMQTMSKYDIKTILLGGQLKTGDVGGEILK